MKLLFGLLLSTLFILGAWGWTSIELTDNTKDHPGYCYSKTENVGAMEKGEVKTVKGQCVQVSCGGNTDIHYYGCGRVGGPPECKVTDVDLSKPYPDCCPDIECPNMRYVL